MNLPRPRSMLLISAVAVVVAVTVLAAINHRGQTHEPVPNSADPTTSASAALSAEGPGLPTTDIFGNRLDVPRDPAGDPLAQDPALRPDPGQPNYLTVAPARLQWQRGWGGAALPFSGSDGPAAVAGGVSSGFADTPQGAGLAACDAIARAFAAPEDLWRTVIRERYLGGGQSLIDRIARSRAETPNAATYLVVPEGVRILPGYRPDFAVVQIAVRATGGWAYANWPMAWHNDDWRVRVPEDVDSLWGSAIPVGTLAEFGSWKATAR